MQTERWKCSVLRWDGQFPLDLFTSRFQQALSCGFIEPYVDCAGQDSPCKHPRSACKREEEEEEGRGGGGEGPCSRARQCVCALLKRAREHSLCINWLESCLHR